MIAARRSRQLAWQTRLDQTASRLGDMSTVLSKLEIPEPPKISKNRLSLKEDPLYRLDTELNTFASSLIRYSFTSSFGLANVDKFGDSDAEDRWRSIVQSIKSEARSIKGQLLNPRNFPMPGR